MSAIEIVLLIVGFACISISFFVGNRKKDLPASEIDKESRDIWTQKEEELVREQIQQIIQNECEEVLLNTTDQLNRKSNEKIMEFDEFSAQILEKINHNHEEVVFMYSMLSEKEKELKANVATVGKNRTSNPGKSQQKVVPSPKKERVSSGAADNTAEASKSMARKQPESGSVSDTILKMHRGGKSVLEISKELNMGQGEVKLMIALYGGKA